MNRSDNISELVTALAKAQANFEPVYKETDNPAYRSKYADLSTIIKATQPALNKNGLIIVQSVACEVATSTVAIETMLAHSSGQWISDVLHLPGTMRERFDSQSVGSSITYGRRYGWQSMIGVAADVDDDGNAAAGVGSKEAAKAVAVDKLKAHANGDESITISMIETAEGTRFVLAGGGVPIIRAALTGQEKAILDWIQTSTQSSIGGAFLNEFMNLCSKHNVKCLGGDVEIPKAELPTLSDTLTRSIEQANASKDPIITKAVEKEGKKGPYVSITWMGMNINIFGKKPVLDTFLHCCAEHIPVWLETEQSGKYTNFKRMTRMNGVDLADTQVPIPNGHDSQELPY